MNRLIAEVLYKAWREGFSTKSDFARSRANEVAVCACLGLITTKVRPDVYGTKWHITKKGLESYDECYQYY